VIVISQTRIIFEQAAVEATAVVFLSERVVVEVGEGTC